MYRSFFITALAGILAFTSAATAQDEEDVSVEALYRKAVEFNMNGNPAEASKTFERLFDLSGGKDLLFEDYGAQAGGFFFDYGLTLLPQQRWADAKDAFQTCVNAEALAKKVESPIESMNPRKNLAKFQLGFCEAQLGNHEEAIRLYDEYIAANPPASELQQVYASYKLRYGASLMKLGRIDEGIANVQELFDNKDTRNISPQFLVQGMLELGLALVELAEEAGSDQAALEKVSERAHDFLDQNTDSIQLSPLDQFRFGFVDRLRKLGLESTKAGLYSVALRYFAFAPTLEDVKQDINLGLARLPVGAGVPSQYQQLIDRIAEYEKAPIHPDAETLRLISNCYEKLGNRRASRAVYWNLAEQQPGAPQELRAEILHEAARLSSQLGDFSAAQYFGETFMKEMPEDHKLRNNVATFMLQSLFTSREYDRVITVCELVRERYDAGDEQRELADSLYPLALYSTQRHEEAAAPFDEYVKSYPEGGNREIVMFHRASNSLILGKMRESAEKYEDFLKAYPESERFLDNALADLAIARFNLEDYPAAIAASDRLGEVRPDSLQRGRTLNVAGDAYIVQAGNLGKEEAQEAQKAEWEKASIKSYIGGYESAREAMSKDADRIDFHKEVAAEGLWKAADQYFEQGLPEKGIELYDMFFPDFVGTRWEPQISVFALEHLEAAGRGEEALVQVEKMILLLGNQPPMEQDITLLRQAIGSYSEASARIRGVDETVATLDNFPGLDPNNQALLTWLKIQQVIVLQAAQTKMEKDSPEFAAAESKIEDVFESLRLFEMRNLSEFALREIGRYFASTDNPFRGVPYFEELLARTNPEADQFKSVAEMELGKIQMRAADSGEVQAARERFRRIIDKYKDPLLVPDAHLNLAKLYMQQKDWRSALSELDVINKAKSMFKGEREKRAEALFLMGNTLDELDQPAEANQAYLAVVSTYGAFPDWVTQAWEKYIPNSLADFEKMPISTPEEQAEKRKRELALYSLTRKFLYQWQKWTDEDSPSGALRRLRRQSVDMKTEMGITPEEEQKVLFDLGIAPEE